MVRSTSKLWLEASIELQRSGDLTSEAQEIEAVIAQSLTIARQTSAKRQRENNDAHSHFATAKAAYDGAIVQLRKCRESSALKNEIDMARPIAR